MPETRRGIDGAKLVLGQTGEGARLLDFATLGEIFATHDERSLKRLTEWVS